jgi:uncharacterized protein (DUF2132 family)
MGLDQRCGACSVSRSEIHDPGINSSLEFLRKTPGARKGRYEAAPIA